MSEQHRQADGSRAGYTASMLTHTSFSRYLCYRSREDTHDKLSYPEYARMTEGVVAMVDYLLNE